ncbi:DUF721 domain-containing protein [Bacteroidota bacterium]
MRRFRTERIRPTPKPRSLGDIMKEVVEGLGPTSRLAEGAIIAAWQDLSGSQIKSATDAVRVEKRKLIVKLNSASWRQELHLQRRMWRDRLNAELGREAIDEIVFR